MKFSERTQTVGSLPTTNLIQLNEVKPGQEATYAPLICVGQDLSIICGPSDIRVSSIFVSPSGGVVFYSAADGYDVSNIVAELRTWDCDRLDEIAGDYFYATTGQAARIIDIMVRHSRLTFKDGKALSESVNACISNEAFLLLTEERNGFNGYNL